MEGSGIDRADMYDDDDPMRPTFYIANSTEIAAKEPKVKVSYRNIFRADSQDVTAWRLVSELVAHSDGIRKYSRVRRERYTVKLEQAPKPTLQSYIRVAPATLIAMDGNPMAIEAARRDENAVGNIQHTGAFVLWKGFGKKKIRKKQRMRPQGWHGNHPEQKPVKKYDREAITDVPMWAPVAEKATKPRHRENDEINTWLDSLDEAEREEAIAVIKEEDFGFSESVCE